MSKEEGAGPSLGRVACENDGEVKGGTEFTLEGELFKLPGKTVEDGPVGKTSLKESEFAIYHFTE